MIYIDSSALVKLVREERESAALEAWISGRANVSLVSSDLAKVEVIRACRRIDEAALPTARALLARIDLLPLNSPLLEEAADLEGPSLRSLDALHLASALSIGNEIDAFVAYDRRLLDAAAAAGLPTAHPGA